MPPKPIDIGADGWVVRNLLLYGNSCVPQIAIRVAKKHYGEGWKEALESLLTTHVQARSHTDDTVILRKGTVYKNMWVAERVME